MARWRKNEATAALRRVMIYVRDLDGAGVVGTTTFAATDELTVDPGTGIFAAAAGTLANVTRALVVADAVFTAANATEIFTATAHGLLTGDGPINVSNSGGALPTGLTAATDYWIIKIDANTFYLATSLANAIAGTNLTITTDGTGTQTLSDVASTARLVDGAWTYTATQTETNITATYFAVRMSKPGTVQESIVAVDIYDPMSEIWNQGDLENGDTPGDILRGAIGILAGRSTGFGTATEVFKDRTNTKTRYTFAVDSTGRLTVTKGDLT